LITALAGGVGAARFLEGLAGVVPRDEITVVVNTGDDIILHGLHISPDPDIVMYTLAGLVDGEKGWGIKGDTFHCLSMLESYGHTPWFNLGDRDIATHLERTNLLMRGLTLSQVTNKLCRSLGVKERIIPMSDERVQTFILTGEGVMHFEEYLVKRGARDHVMDVELRGVDNAEPAPGVMEAIEESQYVIICPSNPIVSIGPILEIKGVRDALRRTEAKVVAISPIIGGETIKGPADKLMMAKGLEVSAYGVAQLYRDFLDLMVIDNLDEGLRDGIESLGMDCMVTNTIMGSHQEKIRLAEDLLEGLRRIRK
jgi:LPPG:FO 2-phospho-L-lactate transferase